MEKLTKNVAAVRMWLEKNTNAENVATFDKILAQDEKNVPTATAILGICLHGFEAGREFQREHPGVEPGIGYLSE